MLHLRVMQYVPTICLLPVFPCNNLTDQEQIPFHNHVSKMFYHVRWIWEVNLFLIDAVQIRTRHVLFDGVAHKV